MSYDGEVREDEWCSNHACYVWQCPKPKPTTVLPPGGGRESGSSR